MNVELSCSINWPVQVPGVARLTVHPGFPIVVHINCIDVAKAEKVHGLVIKRLPPEGLAPLATVAPPAPVAPVVEEPEPELVAVDKLVRETELPREEATEYTQATAVPRKRGRPSKKMED